MTKVYRFWYTFVMKNYDLIYENAADNYGIITSAEAKDLGIPNVELVKLAQRGRLKRLGHGVYKIIQYQPSAFDKYAEAVNLVGHGAVIYGQSVLAMHELALVNPTHIHVAVKGRLRKQVPLVIMLHTLPNSINKVFYEGIPSQSVYEALLVCQNVVMNERLLDAVEDAERRGLLTKFEAINIRGEIG